MYILTTVTLQSTTLFHLFIHFRILTELKLSELFIEHFNIIYCQFIAQVADFLSIIIYIYHSFNSLICSSLLIVFTKHFNIDYSGTIFYNFVEQV